MATYLNKIKILDSSGHTSSSTPFNFGIGTLREENGNIVYGPEGGNAITLIKYDANSGAYTLMINDTPLQEYIDSNEKFLSEIKLSDDGKKLIFTWNIDIDGEEGPKTKTTEIDITTLLETRSYIIEDPSKADDVEAIEAAVISPIVGDIAIVIRTLVSDKKTRTAYVYNSAKKWEALDGNYNADNVYLTGTVQLSGAYTKVGNIAKDSEAAVKEYNWDGKSIKEVLEDILAKVLYPSKPTPSVSFSLSNAGAKEIGTTITPSFKVTYDPKTYAYGSKSNKTANSGTYAAPGQVTITLGNNSTLTGNMTGDGSSPTELTIEGDSMVVNSQTSYYGTKVACSYSKGAVPLTNTGVEYENAQVGADSAVNKTDTQKITHYREGCFYGAVTHKNFTADSITSDMIRNLEGKLQENYSKKTNLTYEVPVGSTAIIIACPKGKTGPTSVLNTTVNAEMWGEDNFKAITKSVGGADATSSNIGDYSAEYTVYYYVPAGPYTSSAELQIDLG